MHFLDFSSIMGTVRGVDIGNSLMLMLQGMVGIFLVMFIIYLVIVVLGKVSSKENNNNSKK